MEPSTYTPEQIEAIQIAYLEECEDNGPPTFEDFFRRHGLRGKQAGEFALFVFDYAEMQTSAARVRDEDIDPELGERALERVFAMIRAGEV